MSSSFATMPSQSGVAFQDFSFQPSRSAPAPYYPMTAPTSTSASTSASSASSSSYSPRDPAMSAQDLGRLAHQFGQQSLRHDPRTVGNAYYQPAASGPYHQPVPQSHAAYSPHHAAQSHQSPIRPQRQTTSRLQCQAGHIQQLSSLVEHMVATGQCTVCSAEMAVPEPASTWDDDDAQNGEFEDEGFEEPSSIARLSYRRSTELSASGQGYVAKPIRVRKTLRNDANRLR